jgi:predicted alpha-1,2-mannosidase
MKSVAFLLVFMISCSPSKRNIDFINPFLGTGGHGHAYPGATSPFGMVQLSPDNFHGGWDWSSGYHASDSIILGFSHLHLSGTGIGEFGDILIMPNVGKLKLSEGARASAKSGYGSSFSHNDEKASAGYYSVFLRDYNVLAEMTVSKRVGFHRYTFPKSDSARIILNAGYGFGWDWTKEAAIRIENDTLITGFRWSSGWANDQLVHFAMTLSKPIDAFGAATDSAVFENQREIKHAKARAYLNFKTKMNEQVLVKVALSFVSREGALNNLKTEIPHWNFERVKSEAESLWEKELSKVQIETLNEKDKNTFYTAMYHAALAPMTYNDADGKYRGSEKGEKQIHQLKAGEEHYTVFSLWDTFRAWHPLSTILFAERAPGILQSFMRQYEQYGELPVWALPSSESFVMVGYHAIPVIADAFFKGFIAKEEMEKFFEAMKASSMQDARGLKHYRQYGYIPFNLDRESVSKTLEYAYDDACIAATAKALGKTDEYETFKNRALFYRNVFDSTIGFSRGKDSAGAWIPNFKANEAEHVGGTFTEGNSWQYTWFAPHDVSGLIKLMGGKEAFVQKLDSLFLTSSDVGKGAPPDVSGLIGQYAHGNEPSHHIPYLFAYAGAQHKTAQRAREIMRRFYNHTTEGLCGNEDCGQLSAWFLFSALGFYPMDAAKGEYVFGSPLVKKARIKLPNGKFFEIIPKNNSEVNIYIQSAMLNGKPYSKSYITHQELMRGGKLEFVMGASPNLSFGAAAGDAPKSNIE